MTVKSNTINENLQMFMIFGLWLPLSLTNMVEIIQKCLRLFVQDF